MEFKSEVKKAASYDVMSCDVGGDSISHGREEATSSQEDCLSSSLEKRPVFSMGRNYTDSFSSSSRTESSGGYAPMSVSSGGGAGRMDSSRTQSSSTNKAERGDSNAEQDEVFLADSAGSITATGTQDGTSVKETSTAGSSQDKVNGACRETSSDRDSNIAAAMASKVEQTIGSSKPHDIIVDSGQAMSSGPRGSGQTGKIFNFENTQTSVAQSENRKPSSSSHKPTQAREKAQTTTKDRRKHSVSSLAGQRLPSQENPLLAKVAARSNLQQRSFSTSSSSRSVANTGHRSSLPSSVETQSLLSGMSKQGQQAPAPDRTSTPPSGQGHEPDTVGDLRTNSRQKFHIFSRDPSQDDYCDESSGGEDSHRGSIADQEDRLKDILARNSVTSTNEADVASRGSPAYQDSIRRESQDNYGRANSTTGDSDLDDSLKQGRAAHADRLRHKGKTLPDAVILSTSGASSSAAAQKTLFSRDLNRPPASPESLRLRNLSSSSSCSSSSSSLPSSPPPPPPQSPLVLLPQPQPTFVGQHVTPCLSLSPSALAAPPAPPSLVLQPPTPHDPSEPSDSETSPMADCGSVDIQYV